MTNIELRNIDPEDIEDLLLEVEASFDIKFTDNELAHVRTFGDIIDHIKSKIKLVNTDDCTTQQAFYKLRRAIFTTLQIDKDRLTPDTLLQELLPRKTRKTGIESIEQALGFKLSLIHISEPTRPY